MADELDGFDEERLGLPDSTDRAGRTQLLLTAIAESARDDKLDYRMPMAALIDVVNRARS